VPVVFTTTIPTFGREPRLGTNPIAIAVPAGEEPPFVFDAATTTVASNVLRLAERAGLPVAPGLLVDGDGRPVAEPAVPREPYRLTPLGGTPEGSSYKGYGLAAAVDILTGVLSSATAAGTFAPGVAAHHLSALDVDALLPLEEFRSGMDAFLRRLTTTPPAPGHDEVLVAGLREHRAEQEHLRDGVPLPPAASEWLVDSLDRFGLPRPALEHREVSPA
jgi:LDH2 family malate/lactate/ureidoglycolate dehydrogenase